jgi:hypothetical protein
LTWGKIGEKLYVFAGLVEKSLGEKLKYVCNSRMKQMFRNLTRKRKLNLQEEYGTAISNRFEIARLVIPVSGSANKTTGPC